MSKNQSFFGLTAAAIEGVVIGAVAVKAAGTGKPEYVTRETFVRQSGERCPKCQTKGTDLYSNDFGFPDVVSSHMRTRL